MPNDIKKIAMSRVYTAWLMREFIYPFLAVTAVSIVGIVILDAYITFGIVIDQLRLSFSFFERALVGTESIVQIVLGVLTISSSAFMYKIIRNLTRPLPFSL